jgi:hypothetical protein
MIARRHTARALAAATLVVSATRAEPGKAESPKRSEITTDTAAQFYELRSPSGATVITRRRLTSTLGIEAAELLTDAPNPRAPSLTLRLRLRYDADYGGSEFETVPSRPDYLIPGFSRDGFDLMYGYLEGRRFFQGVVGFRLGRQYITDALGWWSFDGGLVRATTPFYFSLEAYGGLEQRGGLTLSTPRFERDGVFRGSREGYDRDPSLYPSYQPSAIAPAVGDALETAGIPWLHGRLTYRRVLNTGGSTVSQFSPALRAPLTYDGTRTSQERIGYAFDATLGEFGGLKAGVAYDLLVRTTANAFASADWYASPKVTVSLDYDYVRPTFDGDSIFTAFRVLPMNDVGLRASWDPSFKLSFAAGVHGRFWESPREDTPSPNASPQTAEASTTIRPMGGVNASARYRLGGSLLGARASAETHSAGHRAGIDLYGERTLDTRFVLQARAGAWSWHDAFRPERDATSLGYVLGAGYKIAPRSLMLADWQHDNNRLVGHRFRAMLSISIALSP